MNAGDFTEGPGGHWMIGLSTSRSGGVSTENSAQDAGPEKSHLWKFASGGRWRDDPLIKVTGNTQASECQ